jgi:hypothetical protein
MYRVIRRIHQYCGLIILAFIMMYALSGFIMTHRPWFAGVGRPAPTTRTAALAQPVGSRSKEQLAADVQRQLGLVGRIQFPINPPPADVTRFWINHPGTELRVDVSRREQVIRLTTQRERWVGKLIMLHKVAGYDAQPVFDLCAFFCDLTGLAMILFAFTGVYLWWKTARNRLWGMLCLTASCAYAVGMMLYFAFAR